MFFYNILYKLYLGKKEKVIKNNLLLKNKNRFAFFKSQFSTFLSNLDNYLQTLYETFKGENGCSPSCRSRALLPFSCWFCPVYPTFHAVITCEMTKLWVQCFNEKTHKGAHLASWHYTYCMNQIPPAMQTSSFSYGLLLPTVWLARPLGQLLTLLPLHFLLGLPAASLLFSATPWMAG